MTKINGPICGHCVERAAVAVDVDTLVPICAPCRGDGSDPDDEDECGGTMSLADRVIGIVHRNAGVTVGQLAEILEELDVERRTLSQALSRLCAMGLMRSDGPRMARRYYVDEVRPANEPVQCMTCRARLTESNTSRSRLGGLQRQCISCKPTTAIDDSHPSHNTVQA